MQEQSHFKPALLVFLAAYCLLWFFISDRLRLNIDEGRYLDGALRFYRGETLYRDFVVPTGPATFWLCGAMFHLLGVSLSHARIPLVTGMAGMVAGVFYLTAGLTTRRFGLAAATLFLFFEASDHYLLGVNHRWDSGSLAFAAVVFGFGAIRRDSRLLAFAAGLCAAGAAFATPTVGLVALPLAGWMLLHRHLRHLLIGFVAGGGLLTAICIAILASKGAFAPMIHYLLWTGANYSAPNRVPYGFSGSGFAEISSGFTGAAKLLFSIVLTWVFLPAILPLLACFGWAAWFWFHRASSSPETKDIVFLLVCSTALFASTYPRWDRGHLLYVAPIFFVLVAALVYYTIPERFLGPMFGAFSVILCFAWWQPLIQAGQFSRIETPSGPLRVLAHDRSFVESLLRRVHPADTLFVYPNFPTVYFLTGAVNPSRFTFLEAGLMTDDDERSALHDLEARPPQWVIYWYVPPERYLKTSPSANPQRLGFPLMEEYLRSRYETVEKWEHWHGAYSILRRRDPAPARPGGSLQ